MTESDPNPEPPPEEISESEKALDDLLDNFVKELDAESANRLLKHMPWHGSLDYAVMKAHLIVQAACADVLEGGYDAAGKRYVYGARLSFVQYLNLARAKIGTNVPDWVCASAVKLNDARNSLAHKLEPGGFDDAVREFVESVTANEPRVGKLSGKTVPVCIAAMVVYTPIVTAFAPERQRLALAAALETLFGEASTMSGLAKLGAKLKIPPVISQSAYLRCITGTSALWRARIHFPVSGSRKRTG